MVEKQLQKRILVVDDDEDVQTLVGSILGDTGYEVDWARDGGEALAKIQQTHTDLVVLDLMMPGMDGWGVLDRLRSLRSRPRVVILSAYVDSATCARAVRAGAAGCVAKPFQIPDLVLTCREALAG